MKGVWSRGTEIEGWGLGNYKCLDLSTLKFIPSVQGYWGPQKNFKIYQFFKTIFVISTTSHGHVPCVIITKYSGITEGFTWSRLLKFGGDSLKGFQN